MSTNAHLIGVGPFSEDIVNYLDYPVHWYKEVMNGHRVITHLFLCSSKYETDQLCNILGIEAMEFSTHEIKKSKIDFLDLNIWCENRDIMDHYLGFEKLLDQGFEFMFVLDT